jgi:5-methylcytosine-specific restriction endonuclease McrA
MGSVPETKQCRKCAEAKPTSAFGRKKANRDGLNDWCRDCNAAATKSYRDRHPEQTKAYATRYARSNEAKEAYRRYREKHREKIKERAKTPERKKKAREYGRAYYWKNPERRREISRKYSARNRALMVRKAQEWRANNLERAKAYDKRRHAENRDRLRILHRIWQANNPHKALQYRHKRRGKRFRMDNVFTAEQFGEMCVFYGNKCLRCGRADVQLTPDHVVPLSRDGLNDLSNIQPLCFSCNSAKGNRWIKDYRPDQGARFQPRQAPLFA